MIPDNIPFYKFLTLQHGYRNAIAHREDDTQTRMVDQRAAHIPIIIKMPNYTKYREERVTENRAKANLQESTKGK
jgi:hypothetical protein